MVYDYRLLVIGLAIAVVWSIYLVLVKMSTLFTSDSRTPLFFIGLGAFLVFLIYAAYNRPMVEISAPVVISLLAGIFWAFGLILLYHGLMGGLEIAKLSPLIGLSILFVSVMGVFLLNEVPVGWFDVLVASSLILLGIYILI